MSGFKRYPAYKDSEVEWFGDVPCNWRVQRLKQVVNPSRPITYGIVQAGENVPDGIPYIRPADMADESGVKTKDALLRTSQEIAIAYRRSSISAGDIVCSIGPSFGKLMVVPLSLEGANLTQGTARVAVANEHVPRFIFWVLRSAESYQQWESSVGGATFRALNLGPLAETFLCVPSWAEQTQIARFLDHETARIDALIAEQQRLIELLKEKRQAVISHAVTKGLDPTVPMKYSEVEWLGEVPAHWEVSPLKHVVATPITDGPHETPEFIDDGVLFVSAEAVSSGRIDFSKARYISREEHLRYSKKYRPQKFDIYMVKSGATTGVTAIVETDDEFNIWSPLAVVRCKPQYSPYFILFSMRSRNFQESVVVNWSFGTQQNIGMNVIENLPVACPPFDEQNRIAKFITQENEKWEKLMSEGVNAVQFLQERRSALISAAVTGKIDVRNWQSTACAQVPELKEIEAV